MKNMLFLLVASILILCTTFLNAQDLRIVYDAEAGSYTYFRNKEQLNKPIVKKGGLIVFEIKNYNNYLYDVEFRESQETLEIGKGSGLLGGVDIMGTLGGIAPALSVRPDEDADGVVDYFVQEANQVVMAPTFSDSEEGLRFYQISQLEQQASAKLQRIASIQRSVNTAKLDVVAIKDQRKLRSVALQEVEKMKYHPQIPPSKIKSYSQSFFSRVFDVSDIEEMDLSTVLQRKSDQEDLQRLQGTLTEYHSNYESEVEQLAVINAQLKAFKAIGAIPVEIDQCTAEAPKVIATMDAVEKEVDSLLSTVAEDDIEAVTSMWYEYEAISANTFSKSFRSLGTGDLVNLDVAFIRKDSVQGAVPQRIPLSSVKVPVYGGIKINASIGVNFGQFLDQPQTYFLRDSSIVGQNGDQFIPYATSFVHFYRQGRKSASIGGSLGIGIPLAGGDNLEATTFFMGPSLFLGNSERVVLNCGVMGGKVRRLGQGLSVGDTFMSPEAFIPTTSVYQLGLYAGCSFNLGR